MTACLEAACGGSTRPGGKRALEGYSPFLQGSGGWIQKRKGCESVRREASGAQMNSRVRWRARARAAPAARSRCRCKGSRVPSSSRSKAQGGPEQGRVLSCCPHAEEIAGKCKLPAIEVQVILHASAEGGVAACCWFLPSPAVCGCSVRHSTACAAQGGVGGGGGSSLITTPGWWRVVACCRFTACGGCCCCSWAWRVTA